MIHEDKRRVLTSIPLVNGEFKVITTKKNCELGNHYHKIKTERFRLLQGESTISIDDNVYKMTVGYEYQVNPNEKHSFKIKKDSILVCICSHTYDSKDDYI